MYILLALYIMNEFCYSIMQSGINPARIHTRQNKFNKNKKIIGIIDMYIVFNSKSIGVRIIATGLGSLRYCYHYLKVVAFLCEQHERKKQTRKEKYKKRT